MKQRYHVELEQNKAFIEIAHKYPHIAKKIDAFWSSEVCVPYLESLFTDTRSGSRKGFPHADILLLLDLKILHEARFSKFVKKDVWDYSD